MPDEAKRRYHAAETRTAEMTEPAPFRLAQAKMGTLFGTVAGLVTLALSISQGKSIANIAHLVATSALIFWFIGWCAAFLVNRYLNVAHRRLAEQQCEGMEDGQPTNGEDTREQATAAGD